MEDDRLNLTVSTQKSVLKICTESQVITKKLSKIGIPNQTIKIWHIFADISGLGAYFSKPIFALKPWDWAESTQGFWCSPFLSREE